MKKCVAFSKPDMDAFVAKLVSIPQKMKNKHRYFLKRPIEILPAEPLYFQIFTITLFNICSTNSSCSLMKLL